MKKYMHVLAVLILSNLLACQGDAPGRDNAKDRASVVELREHDGRYRLYVDGEEFYVKGAGCEFGDIGSLADHGANALRTWRMDNGMRTAGEVLDEAHEHGLMVLMGINVARERHGFDYNDTAAVAAQLECIRKDAEKIMDHPALLGWGIGNELNLHYTNKKVWDAVDDIAAMLDEIDGKHVTTTMLSGIGKDEVDYIEEHCEYLDFISIQMYADIINLQKRIDDAGYTGPYLVTEWGATGHWESPRTNWDVAIEQTSTEKADAIKERYQKAILVDEEKCLGSFVFLWGQKQERTPTWYGLFTEEGEETEAIDVMHKMWTGKWPDNRVPRLVSALLDGKERFDNIYLEPGEDYRAEILAVDPDDDSLSYRVEILHESNDLKMGGDRESRPDSVPGLVHSAVEGRIEFTTPGQEGPYRLFVYVLDHHNHAATVNFPFFVQGQKNE